MDYNWQQNKHFTTVPTPLSILFTAMINGTSERSYRQFITQNVFNTLRITLSPIDYQHIVLDIVKI